MNWRGQSMLIRFLLSLGALVATTACGGDDGDPNTGGAASVESLVSGSVTLPADASGTCAMIALDDDASGSNSVARRADGSYLASFEMISGSSIGFSFGDAPVGSYYLWAYIDVDSSASDPTGDCEITGAPTSGDHFGYYDTGLSEPSSANVRVPHAEGSSFDFQLGVVP